MKGHLHYPTRAIQTECHVLWNVQLTSHFPSIHGWSLWRLYHKGLVGNLHGQSTNPFLEPGITWWTYLESSTMFPRTRDVSQTGKMHILSWRNGVPQHDSRKRRNTDGPHQTQGHQGMVSTGQHQGCPILPWILQLLLKVHSFLFQHCPPPLGPHQTVKPLDLGTWPREHVLQPTNCIHQTTSPSLPQYLQTLHLHDRCLANSIRSCTDAAECQQRHAIMWLSLLDILPGRTELQHLWPWITHCNSQPWRMETIPPRISLPCRGSYRP